MSDYYSRRAYDICQRLAQDVASLKETQKNDSRRMSEGFNRLAKAIEELTGEVRQLRKELSPQSLDKPKLPTPDRGA
jgi:hypothetical protein